MTELSPAAQAILDAHDNAPWENFATADRLAVAAALRAVADQIYMKQPLGNTDADAGVFAAHHAIYFNILAIAHELEAKVDAK